MKVWRSYCGEVTMRRSYWQPKPQGSTINMNNLISAVLTINQDVEPVF